ncbi:(S)-N-methylcoclaurine 3'-hydroxylase isozyme 1 (Fragment) [Linum perenne]
MASPNQTHCSSERSSLFSLTIITLILLPLLYLLSTKHFRKATSSAPPIPSGPYQWPLIGNIFQLGTNPHLTLTHFAQSYGPLFSLKLGTQLVVVASSKDAAIEVLRTHELLSAGTDTSSSTIEWMMAELIKNPKCMKRVKQACFKETLRLHPPGPFLLPHRAISSCEVMNRSIPKNSQVLVNFWAIGRDPENWREPLIFSPERFLSSNVDYKGNDFEFIPFGSGRRICPGLSMATRHASLIVASLIHCFDWSLPDGESPVELDMSDKYGLTLRKKQPLILIPRVKH